MTSSQERTCDPTYCARSFAFRFRTRGTLDRVRFQIPRRFGLSESAKERVSRGFPEHSRSYTRASYTQSHPFSKTSRRILNRYWDGAMSAGRPASSSTASGLYLEEKRRKKEKEENEEKRRKKKKKKKKKEKKKKKRRRKKKNCARVRRVCSNFGPLA